MEKREYEERSPLILEELDPSPVDETAPESEKDYFPSQPRSSSSTFGLYTAHGAPYYCEHRKVIRSRGCC